MYFKLKFTQVAEHYIRISEELEFHAEEERS